MLQFSKITLIFNHFSDTHFSKIKGKSQIETVGFLPVFEVLKLTLIIRNKIKCISFFICIH